MKTVEMLIDTPELFDFDECLWFLHRNYDECLYAVSHDGVRRAIRISSGTGLIWIRTISNQLHLSILKPNNPSLNLRIEVRRFVQDWFDLARDIAPFYTMLDQHPSLQYLKESYYGLRLMGIPDMFEAICWCIIGQQINLAFAYKLKRRIVERYGTYVVFEGEKYWIFPSPKQLLSATSEELRSMQFSKQKIKYLLEAAQSMVSGDLSRQVCDDLPNMGAKLAYLQTFKGIGPWTANYVLMKCLGEVTAIPWGDAGLLAALEKHNLISDRKDRKSIQASFEKFQGFESYLVLYFWRSLTHTHEQ